MNLYVLLKMVPDTVEELNVSADGKSLDSEFLRFKLSEPDDHALEQALILKEKHGVKVTVVALDAPEVDDVLFTALAKGADRAVKIPINHRQAPSLASADRLLYRCRPDHARHTPSPGSQAIDDLKARWLCCSPPR
jgi:electron transfer flavoprotein beta subunit